MPVSSHLRDLNTAHGVGVTKSPRLMFALNCIQERAGLTSARTRQETLRTEGEVILKVFPKFWFQAQCSN